jgi:hypothetical protein
MYIFMHGGDQRMYHTDIEMASLLHRLRPNQPVAYEAVFHSAQGAGCIHEGAAPSVELAVPSAPGARPRVERGAEPSVTD